MRIGQIFQAGPRPNRNGSPSEKSQKRKQYFFVVDSQKPEKAQIVRNGMFRGPSLQRSGQHGIRGNDRWRVCFRWTDSGPEDVEIVDYH